MARTSLVVRSSKKCFAFPIAAALFVASSPANALDPPIVGGPGGGPFPTVMCPAKTAVVGLQGKAGAFIDTMEVICGNPLHDTPDLPPSQVIGRSRGGGPAGAHCQPLSGLGAVDVQTGSWFEHPVISEIGLHCHGADLGDDSYVPIFGFTRGRAAGSTGCDIHSFVAGIQGRDGDFIDAIGVICRPISDLN